MLIDPFLQNVIRFAERRSGRLPITLNVNGELISGLIVSEEEFVKGLALGYDQYRAELSEEQAEGSEEQTEPSEAAIEVYREMFGWEPGKAAEHLLYVHLYKPFFHQPSALSSGMQGEWWRGRLEAVDGFQFGRPST
jgi:hypothetical protein